MNDRFVVSGTFLHTPVFGGLEALERGYLLVEDGLVRALSTQYEAAWQPLELLDYRAKLILPAYVDLHLHAVQYVNRGLGYDKGLLEWLDAYTFPEEARFLEPSYADSVFADLAEELWQGGTLFSCHYANAALATTRRLIDVLAEAGLAAAVGKVNMDRFGGCMTETTAASIAETNAFVSLGAARVRPILTPRFAPSCSPELLTELGRLAAVYDLPVQTHLNETVSEVAWVRELFPEAIDYFDVYERFGLIRPEQTILAHAIYNTPREIERMKANDVLLAHCPASNANITSGIMKVKELAAEGIRIGLGSDISGGDQLFMNRVMEDAVKMSKLLAVRENDKAHSLSEAEVFYLATKGGAAFFGERGTFEEGARFNALVVDDSRHTKYRTLTPAERLQKWIYLGQPAQIEARFLNGQLLEKP